MWKLKSSIRATIRRVVSADGQITILIEHAFEIRADQSYLLHAAWVSRSVKAAICGSVAGSNHEMDQSETAEAIYCLKS